MKNISILMVLFSSIALASECPKNFTEAGGEKDVRTLISSQQAFLVFAEDIVLPAGQSKKWLGNVVVTDLNGASLTNRRVRAEVPRQMLTYDNGHSGGDVSYFIYTNSLRVHFEGSKFYPTYETLKERSHGMLLVCLGEAEKEI